MAPSRAKQASTPSAVAGPSRERPSKAFRSPHAKKPRRLDNDDVLPGVQKLKSALRQTRRLLARDNLAADVRVKTERRLKALEADLARAEQSRKARHYATKYHKVKFFERQKVVRKINQIKRSIETAKGKQKAQFESTLVDLRVDLNYILHFPKTEKYVSLFPPEVRDAGATAVPTAVPSDYSEERLKVRELIRQRMERGELSFEPEKELGKPGQETRRLTSSQLGRADVAPSIKLRTTDGVAKDDFFGDDEDEESQQSEA